MSGWEAALKLGGALLALCLVLLLAWLMLRWMSRRAPGASGGGRAIKVLDRVAAGRNGSLLLLRVKDKVLLVGFSDHAVQTLCEFDDPDGSFEAQQAAKNPAFSDALKDAARKMGFKPKDGGGHD